AARRRPVRPAARRSGEPVGADLSAEHPDHHLSGRGGGAAVAAARADGREGSDGMITPFRADSPLRESIVMALVAIALLGLPWFLPLIGGYTELATQILLWGIFALGFDILIGFTGLLSFGHAAFWGLGSYAAGLMLLRVSEDIVPAVLVGTLVGGLAAVLLGYLPLRRRGIYFSTLTLAFAEMFYYAALAPLQKWTGGDNGLTGIPAANLFGITMKGEAIYYVIAATAFVGIYVARRIVRSPYGLILRAIKSNETRVASTG